MKDSPLLLHVPHASVWIPEEYRNDYAVGLEGEIRCMTDWYTDELFDYPASKLVFPISRLVCDVERFRDDSAEEMSRRGMGACYTHGHDGARIRRLAAERKKEILERWYDPHHRALAALTEELLEKHGACMIVDCHSFPKTPLPYEPDQRKNRPDICIGTDAYHTRQGVSGVLAEAFAGMGYSVSVNAPYAGSMVPMPYYHADARVGSVMIEINRGLYLDDTCQKLPAFSRVRQDVAAALAKLAAALRDDRRQTLCRDPQD